MDQPEEIAAIAAACPRRFYGLPCAMLDDRAIGKQFCHVCQHKKAAAENRPVPVRV